jgi:hypothetical protein
LDVPHGHDGQFPPGQFPPQFVAVSSMVELLVVPAATRANNEAMKGMKRIYASVGFSWLVCKNSCIVAPVLL